MKTDLFWVPGPWRGRLAIARRPRGGDWLDDEASAWRQADIDVVVSLLENDEAAQLDLLRERQAAEKGAWLAIGRRLQSSHRFTEAS